MGKKKQIVEKLQMIKFMSTSLPWVRKGKNEASLTYIWKPVQKHIKKPVKNPKWRLLRQFLSGFSF